MPLPALSFDVGAALTSSLVAAVTYMLALSVSRLPSESFSVILFTTAFVSAAVALPVLAVRGRAEADRGLQWASTGLALAWVALGLQLLSYPTVTDNGGVLGTSNTGSSLLYLAFHLAWFGCAAAGALRAPGWLQRAVLGGGLVVIVLAALDLLPVPVLLRADNSFTPLLRGIQVVLCVLGVASVGLWVMASGRRAGPLRGWVGVSLLLLTYELAVNTVAGRRYSALWWSSLSLRAAAFAVVAAGALAYLLRHMRRVEAYSSAELVLRDAELTSRVAVIDQLLTSARDLATAHTPTDVARVLCAAARQVTGAATVAVSHYDPERQAWVRLASHPVSSDAVSSDAVSSDAVSSDGGSTASAGEPSEVASGGRLGVGPLVPALTRVVDGRALYVRSPEELAARGASGAQVEAFEAGPDGRRLEAVAVLPLTARGGVAGILEVGEYSPRPWSEADRELLQGLADQGGPALSRARLALREHQAAETLQRSLLPSRLPEPPGLVLSAVYRPAVRDNQVGGDWYDAWTLPDGRVALVIGDVVGKGLAAAATTGRLRASMRALAANDPSPAHVLTRLDELEAEDGSRMVATVTYALLDADLGRASLARAGHLPPVLVRPEGEARLVLHEGGAPIGLVAEPFTEVTVELPAGAALLLYTDGLVEDRTTSVDAQLESLVRAAAGCARTTPLRELPDALMSWFRPSGDDVAVLVAARRSPAP